MCNPGVPKDFARVSPGYENGENGAWGGNRFPAHLQAQLHDGRGDVFRDQSGFRSATQGGSKALIPEFSALGPLSGYKQTFGERVENDASDRNRTVQAFSGKSAKQSRASFSGASYWRRQ